MTKLHIRAGSASAATSFTIAWATFDDVIADIYSPSFLTNSRDGPPRRRLASPGVTTGDLPTPSAAPPASRPLATHLGSCRVEYSPTQIPTAKAPATQSPSHRIRRRYEEAETPDSPRRKCPGNPPTATDGRPLLRTTGHRLRVSRRPSPAVEPNVFSSRRALL